MELFLVTDLHASLGTTEKVAEKWQVKLQLSGYEANQWYDASKSQDGQEKLWEFHNTIPEHYSCHGVYFSFRVDKEIATNEAEAGTYILEKAQKTFDNIFGNGE